MYNLHVVNKWLFMLNKWYLLSFFWQSAFFAVFAAIVSFAYDKESAISAFLGGLAYCVPTLLSNVYVHHTKRLKSALVRAYLGTVYRFIMVSAILVYLLKETELSHAVMIGCFCLATVVQYVTSFWFLKRN